MRDSVEWPAVNGRVIPERKLQDSQGSPPREPQSLPHSPPASRQSLSKSPKKSPSPVKRQDSDHTPTPQIPPSSIYASDLETSTENPYEVDPTYQNTWEAVSSSPQYENVNLSTSGESGQTLPHPPPTSKSPKRTRPSIPDSGNDYDDIEGECVQTQVQTESHRLHSTTPSPPLPPLPPVPKYVPVNGDDYVDLDADNTYINPQELRHSTSSASSVTSPTPSAAVAAMNKPLPSKPVVLHVHIMGHILLKEEEGRNYIVLNSPPWDNPLILGVHLKCKEPRGSETNVRVDPGRGENNVTKLRYSES